MLSALRANCAALFSRSSAVPLYLLLLVILCIALTFPVAAVMEQDPSFTARMGIWLTDETQIRQFCPNCARLRQIACYGPVTNLCTCTRNFTTNPNRHVEDDICTACTYFTLSSNP